ncbi:HAD family hydrolase [Paenibacillus septentrionalis]|uniref:HAD family hydrolase n=1 Tax=Paenibacillus septentrionalis TaxID=429342 RepID=A0ABW1V5P5_9BACL
MLKAIIFDLDGTIIDTESSWFNAFCDIYKQYDVDFTLELYSTCIGTGLDAFNPYDYLIQNSTQPIELAELKQAVAKRFNELMLQEAVRPGVTDYLDQAKAAGLKLAVASSSSRDWVERYLNQLGLLHYFDAICTASEVKQVKPDPELYELALQKLQVQASEAVAIEDSPNGARGAVAAGIHCIVVPNPITKTLNFDIPHQRLSSLSELEFQELLTKPLQPTHNG